MRRLRLCGSGRRERKYNGRNQDRRSRTSGEETESPLPFISLTTNISTNSTNISPNINTIYTIYTITTTIRLQFT